MPTLFRDWFADRPIEVPAVALAAGYVDDAWHNDAAPKMTYRSSETAEVVVTLWLGDEWTKKDCGGNFFCLEVGPCEADGSWPEDYDERRRVIHSGDDLDEVLRLAVDTAERLKAGASLESFPSIRE